MPRGETWGTMEVCGNPGCGQVVGPRMAFCVTCGAEEGVGEVERAAVFAERAALRTGAGVPFLAEPSSTGYGWVIAGPDGSTDGWGSYTSKAAAVWSEEALTRAYEAGTADAEPDPGLAEYVHAERVRAVTEALDPVMEYLARCRALGVRPRTDELVTALVGDNGGDGEDGSDADEGERATGESPKDRADDRDGAGVSDGVDQSFDRLSDG